MLNFVGSPKSLKTAQPQEMVKYDQITCHRINSLEHNPQKDSYDTKMSTGKKVGLGFTAFTTLMTTIAGLRGRAILKEAGKKTGFFDCIATGTENFFKSKKEAVAKLKEKDKNPLNETNRISRTTDEALESEKDKNPLNKTNRTSRTTDETLVPEKGSELPLKDPIPPRNDLTPPKNDLNPPLKIDKQEIDIATAKNPSLALRKIKNPDGSSLEYDSLGRLHFKYDAKNNLILHVNYNTEGSVNWYKKCEYDANNKLILDVFYNADGSVGRYNKYEYGANNKLILHVSYNADGSVGSYGRRTYDANNNEILDVRYSANGSVGWYRKCKYDEKNNPIFDISFEANGSYRSGDLF